MNADKVAKLEAIYTRVPAITCRGLCHDACGPIALSRLEGKRIEKKVHRLPRPDPGTLTCSLLRFGRCEAYALRPLICRLYGTVERLRCPHGCLPARWLSDAEAYALMSAVSALSPMVVE